MTSPTRTLGDLKRMIYRDHGGYLSNARQLDRGFCDPELTDPIHRFSYFSWRARKVRAYSVVDSSAASIQEACSTSGPWGEWTYWGRDGPNFACGGPFAGQNLPLREQIMAASISGLMTMTGKATSVYDPKPMAYKAVRVWLSDGSRMLGMWTGTKWWSLQGEIRPVRWELEERKKKKTDKLRKVIPKQFA